MTTALPIRRRRDGMTLVEVVIAMAILAVFMIGMMGYMTTLTDSTGVQQQAATVLQTADKAVLEMTGPLRMGFIPGTSPDWRTAVNGGSNTVRFVVPVDPDGDGDDLDDDLQVVWGSMRPDAVPGHVALETGGALEEFYNAYTFVQAADLDGNPVFFQESTRGLDLNNDGDATDSYRVGHLELHYVGGTVSDSDSPHNGETFDTLEVRITPDIVLFGDLDGDGSDEPIFTLNGSELTVDLYMCRVNEDVPLLQRVTTTLDLRNQP
jgi:prepilin-type N-terminal cleavage/methylation domain-containing protein